MSTNIWIATADDKRDVVKSLIETGRFTANSKDANGYTPMHAAASYGNNDLLEYLILKGGDVNIQDNDGDTPLHHTESLATAKLLIEKNNADYTVRNSDGQTALEALLDDNDSPELIQYLQSLQTNTSARGSLPLPLNENMSLPNGEEVKMYLSGLREEDSPELTKRRQELEQIMTQADISESEKDEQLKMYVMNALSQNIQGIKGEEDASTDHMSKKRR
ncbi:hypothetical protein FOA43_003408 [Brettanomyces nanus]|uniref:Ankyrin repeat-containing protein n=1 Tax=Eeniella nana TaxID=13502 RepID=A0A875S7X4_EENNA|nr:uncharacterized protein FOA43_003408 [Brettanomyces nanus]QPG76022.1 hypothetical protein FOA43_003408 [Brettanomyces nanus]